ncbi:MAG: hypothetical protein D6681_01460 [Calditrichaeota bacterium]|nr:MAG: hypothetical protein D6681_01460 [Calditrichota bacterium]
MKDVTFLSVTVLMIFCLSFFPGLQAQQVTAVYLCQSVMEPGTVPVDITRQFGPDAPKIHAVVIVDGLQQGMVLKGAWVSVDAIDVPNYEIDAVEVRVQESGSGRVHFSLSRPNNGWPAGNYRFDFYVNDQPVTSATFSIGGAATSPPRSAPTPPPAKLPPQVPPQTRPQSQPQPQPQPSNSYTGTYTLNSQGVVLTLVLQQDAQGNVLGSLTSTTGGQFRVEGTLQDGAAVGTCYDQQGGVYFEAHLQGNQLLFTMIEPGANGMPDYTRSRQLVFVRGGAATAPGQMMAPGQPGAYPYPPQGMGQPPMGGNAGIPAPSGQEAYLQGKFCHWSGSSSYATGEYSGYSSTTWAYFDGQGNFTYGSEAAYTGSEGSMYNQSPGGEMGQYRVMGNQVLLYFADGSQGVATVHVRQPDGRITELMYEGDLYAVQLCD